MESQRHPETQRVALVIQYLGSHFHGWQRQPRHRSVQEVIEQTIAAVVEHPVTLSGAGRTDAGVHAAAQVAHFDTTSRIPAQRWASILNQRLPADVLVRGSTAVERSWHSRFSAIWRRYRYSLYTDSRPNLFLRDRVWHYYHQPLDAELMQAALDPLLGQQHLAAFHRAHSGRAHSWVEVQAVECLRRGPLVEIEIQSSGFLYGMMRLLVGLLVQVGTGERSLASFTQLWQNERRDLVKYSAPAQGLCLLRVGYPDPPFTPEVYFDTQPRPLFSDPMPMVCSA